MLRNALKNGFVFFKDSQILVSKHCTPVHRSINRTLSNSSSKPPVADDIGAQSLTSSGPRESSVKVLYDGGCSLCVHEISALRYLARRRPVDFVDINSPAFRQEEYGGVTYEMAMKEMHVIGADGKVHVQGDAIREMYRACGLSWLSRATELPGIREVCDNLYVRFAHFRLQRALDRCDSGDSCSIKLRHLRDKLRPPR